MKGINQQIFISKKNYAAYQMRSMIKTLTAERQKPRSAKNEAFDVASKVGLNNPVRQHITLYVLFIQDCFAIHQPYNTLARDGYTNGNVSRRVPTLKTVIKIPSSDRPLSTWPMKQPLADRFADRMLRETRLRGTIKYLAGFAGNSVNAACRLDTFMGEIGEAMSKINKGDKNGC
jgi:hypothetical protein